MHGHGNVEKFFKRRFRHFPPPGTQVDRRDRWMEMLARRLGEWHSVSFRWSVDREAETQPLRRIDPGEL